MTLSGGLTILYDFPGGTGGANPYGCLVQGTNGNFYGTTYQGGVNGDGTLFSMTSSSAVSFIYSFTGGVDGAEPLAGLCKARWQFLWHRLRRRCIFLWLGIQIETERSVHRSLRVHR